MPYADKNDPRKRIRKGRYRHISILEENGFVTISMLCKNLDLKAKQVSYWAELGLIHEPEESIKRREGYRGRGTRFYGIDQAIKIVYMSHLVNDGGLHPRVAARYADILKDRPRPESDIHWIEHKNIIIGIKHLGGIDETIIRTSRRIREALAG